MSALQFVSVGQGGIMGCVDGRRMLKPTWPLSPSPFLFAYMIRIVSALQLASVRQGGIAVKPK